MFIIITVDDLGLHPAVRRAVKQLSLAGKITSVSLLANGPDVENCFDFNELGIGVQLNVLQGRPLSRQENVSSMLRHDGCFLGDYDVMFKRFLDGKVQLGQIETEWAAQIEFVLDHSVKPTHLTSHQSMHAWPGLMNIAGRLAQRYGIGWIRKPPQCESVLDDAPGNRSDFLNICTMLQTLPEPIRTPDLVWGTGQEQGDGQPMSFLKKYRAADYNVIEIVNTPAHPKHGDKPIANPFVPGPTRAQWGTALIAMESKQWRMVWEELDVKIVHYGQLNGLNKI